MINLTQFDLETEVSTNCASGIVPCFYNYSSSAIKVQQKYTGVHTHKQEMDNNAIHNTNNNKSYPIWFGNYGLDKLSFLTRRDTNMQRKWLVHWTDKTINEWIIQGQGMVNMLKKHQMQKRALLIELRLTSKHD